MSFERKLKQHFVWFQVLYYIHSHVKELALIIACLKELTTK